MLRCADCNAVKDFRVIGKSVAARVHKFSFFGEAEIVGIGGTSQYDKVAGTGHH